MARRRPPAPPPQGDLAAMPDDLVRPPRNAEELHTIRSRRAAWMAEHGADFTYRERHQEYLRRFAPHVRDERKNHER